MNSLVGLSILFVFLIALAFLSGKKFFGSESFFPFGGNFPDTNASSLDRPHPVLAYQREASYDTHPASWGDPIRPLGISSGPSMSSFSANPSRGEYKTGTYIPAYEMNGPESNGPAPGMMMNVPVPAGSLKESNEKWDYPFYYQQKPLQPYDYFKPYGPNQNSMQQGLVYADTPFYKRNLMPGGDSRVYRPYSGASNIYGDAYGDAYNNTHGNSFGNNIYPGSPRPALGYTGSGAIPFVSSVSSYAPFPEVTTEWEKIGMIQTVDPKDNTIMNLYRKPIAPLQDLYQYMVQNKDGFVIPLNHVNYLENGDIVGHVQGFESLGPWKANVYVNNKWVWA